MNEKPAAMSERGWSVFQLTAEQLRPLEEIEREDIVRCLQEEFPELDDAGAYNNFCHWCGPGVPADSQDSQGREVCAACALKDDDENGSLEDTDTEDEEPA